MRALRARTDNTSGYAGVSKRGSNWRAQIKINGKIKHLGTFLTAKEAGEKYQEALLDPHAIQSRRPNQTVQTTNKKPREDAWVNPEFERDFDR